MPLSPWEAVHRGQISSEELEIPRQSLAAEQVDAFLDFVFSDLLRKAEPLSLQAGAAVAHYLLALAHSLPEREDRVRLLGEAQLLWRALFNASWKLASKTGARRFL